MKYRRFGRTGWMVSEIGYGMWGMGGDWKGSEDEQSLTSLGFILNNPTVSTIIPGMRKLRHVESNLASSDAGPLPEDLHAQLREHRWDREPTEWSQ